MNRFQLQSLYKVNGLGDYKLKTADDIYKIYGIDYKNLDVYNRLDDINRVISERFIVNFYNGLGLESRDSLVPEGIFFIESITYLIKVEDDYFMVADGIRSSGSFFYIIKQ